METLTKSHSFDTLSPSQKDVAKVLEEYLLYGTVKLVKQDFVVLKGYAGTGKTYTINRVIDSIQKLSIAMSAPTHKAVQVLRKTSERPPGQIVFATIHSLLGLTQHIDEASGKVTYVESKDFTEKRISGVNLLIVDEASMLDPLLFASIMRYYKEENENLRIVFTGDPLQAPPVGEKQSPVFLDSGHSGYVTTTVELSEPMRQAKDNPILGYGTAIRQNIFQDVAYEPFVATTENEGIEVIQETDFIDSILPLFGEDFERNQDHMKVLAWTNEAVNKFNTIIRRYRLRDPNPAKIVVGDYLVADKPIKVPSQLGGMMLIANTSEEMKVVDVVIKEIQIPVNFYQSYSQMENELLSRIPEAEKARPKDWITNQIRIGATRGMESRTYKFLVYMCTVELVRLNNLGKEEVIRREIRIIHETSEKLHKDVVNYLAKVAKAAYSKGKAWREFYGFQDLFAQIKYNYALTVHKSQGSTYENCLVYMSDINRNKWVEKGVDVRTEERNRLKYVAVTRAKKKLFILP